MECTGAMHQADMDLILLQFSSLKLVNLLERDAYCSYVCDFEQLIQPSPLLLKAMKYQLALHLF